MEEKLHKGWVKIGGKKGSIFNGIYIKGLNSGDFVGEFA
jgi:hypothetical protein